MPFWLNLVHGKEESPKAKRDRLRVFNELERAGYPVDRSKTGAAKWLDQYLFKSQESMQFRNEAENLLKQVQTGRNGSGVSWEAAPKSAFDWMPKDDRRFFNWIFVYGRQAITQECPLFDNDHITSYEKVVLWFDFLIGDRKLKESIGNEIKAKWHENIKIDKVLNKMRNKKEWSDSFFWEQTLLRFKGTDVYDLAKFVHPGFDIPATDEECFYSAVLIYDLANLDAKGKEDILRSIRRKLDNNKRVKKQINISLSQESAREFDEICKWKGVKRSELLEEWIWRESNR